MELALHGDRLVSGRCQIVLQSGHRNVNSVRHRPIRRKSINRPPIRGINPSSNLWTIDNRRSPIDRASAQIGTGHVNLSSIYRQSIGDQLVTNLGTRVLWRPTEVSSRRTNRAALGLSNRSKQRNDSPNGSPSSANTMPIQCQSIAMQNQSKTNGLPILASSICKSIQM